MKSIFRVGGALAALGLISIVLHGCDVASQTLVSCDPLQTVTTPVTLGQVVGIGKDQEGTVYLVDEAPNVGQRLFVSMGSVLVRQPVGGIGSVGDTDGGMLIVVGGGDAASPLSIEVRTDAAGHATAMGIFKGLLATKFFDLGSEGESLQLLTTDAISEFTLQNLPGTLTFERMGTLADGRELIVTTPDVDATENDVRVFFGTPSELKERRVTPTVQPMSYTTLTFDLDGRQAVATFSSALNTGVVSALSVAGQVFPVTDAPVGTNLAGVTFLCIGR